MVLEKSMIPGVKMKITPFLLLLSMLSACGGDKNGDTGEELVVTIDPVHFLFSTSDSVTQAPVVGSEVCIIEPTELSECLTTNDDGEIEYSWESPSSEGDILNRITHPDYITTLNTGFFDARVHDTWASSMEEDGEIPINYAMHTMIALDAILGLSDLSREEGKGHLAYILFGEGGVSVEGAVISLKNNAGESVGTVVYGDTDGVSVSLDTSLTATSSGGGFSIINVERYFSPQPHGEYTLEIAHDSLSCKGSVTDQPNSFRLPLEADSLTRGFLYCE
jgi:hypothetical protein